MRSINYDLTINHGNKAELKCHFSNIQQYVKSYLILLELEFRSPGNYRISLTGGTICNRNTRLYESQRTLLCIAPVVGTGPGTKPPTALASSRAKTGM